MKYAKDNNILIVAAAGNEGNLLSALGQASTEYNNIITVGASQNNYRAAYSSYGGGLDILAPTDTHQTAETATNATKQGTSIAAAKVTNTISQMWAINPSLDYQKTKNILLNTAKDIDIPEWDQRTGYGILDAGAAIATAGKTIPTIPVIAATKQLIKPLISADENTTNTAAKPSSRAALTNATTNQPKTTSTSTGDYNVGTSSSTTEQPQNTTSNTSKYNNTTSTNAQTNRSYSHTNSNWNKSRTNTNSNSNSLYETTTDTTTKARDYTDKNLSLYSIERTNKSQENISRLKYEGTGNSQSSYKQKWSSNRNYTSPSQTQKSASDSYLNSQTQSDGKHDGSYAESNSKTQEESGSKSTANNQYTSSNGSSGDNSTTQKKGKTNRTSSTKGNNSNSTYSGENSEVTQSNSHSKTSSNFSKTNNSRDNRSITNNTWDNTTTNGKTVGSSTRDTYSEGNNNHNTSYDDGKSKNTSNTDTYTQNQSQETNSTNGTNSWRNNRDNSYSVTSGNNIDTYKNGGDTRNHNRDHYSINKSNSSSSNSAGKPSSKNESERYYENQDQWDSEYKADTYTTKSNSDELTITASKSNSNTEGNNTNSSNSSDTSTTRNSQTVTTYKDGRKEENGSSTYEKWLRDSSYDSKGVVSDVYKYSRWSSSYTKSYFKGGYRWTETISGYDSESTTKRAVYTSNGSSWSWTRSGTVWDDGRNDWSESWSKSSWKDGKYLPSESESKRGGFDPKKTGSQVNDVPRFGEPPRLNKAPKNKPIDLNKPPKPSQDIWTPPRRITPRRELENAPDNWFGGAGGNPKDSDIDIKAAIDYNNAQAYSKDAIRLIQRVVGAGQTGVFGEDTVRKIAGWQSAHRLKRDGKVDPNTLWSIVTELRMRNQPLDALLVARSAKTRQYVTDANRMIPTGFGPSGRTPGRGDAQSFVETLKGNDQLTLSGELKTVGDATTEYNCHGFTFLAGAEWIKYNSDVETIIKDNGYSVTRNPSVGDVVIYRDDKGEIQHSGIVAAVSGDKVTRVISKWAMYGLHEHNLLDVPKSYGQKTTVYKSTRTSGNFPQGLGAGRPGNHLLRPR